MRTLQELEARLAAYDRADYIYLTGVGYIAWHWATGENVEALFLETVRPKREAREDYLRAGGYGRMLYREFAKELIEDGKRPFESVYSFRRSDNRLAELLYRGMGWEQRDLGEGIYRGVGTTIMWIKWEKLLETLEIKR